MSIPLNGQNGRPSEAQERVAPLGLPAKAACPAQVNVACLQRPLHAPILWGWWFGGALLGLTLWACVLLPFR